jgi:2Fe-2S ferredoxin
MPTINYIEADGRSFAIEADVGSTLMQVAVDNLITGIVAECGGGCCCATCHVFIDDNNNVLTKADDTESLMLQSIPSAQPNSRLSCQIPITDELDGLIINLPESQY